jgi:hypothetical protein
VASLVEGSGLQFYEPLPLLVTTVLSCVLHRRLVPTSTTGDQVSTQRGDHCDDKNGHYPWLHSSKIRENTPGGNGLTMPWSMSDIASNTESRSDEVRPDQTLGVMYQWSLPLSIHVSIMRMMADLSPG